VAVKAVTNLFDKADNGAGFGIQDSHMQRSGRRDFLKAVAAASAAGALPPAIAKALALPAARRTGTLADVEHVVILMQENRSFDHYYGTLRGVRGYGDPRPLLLRNGRSVFHQPAPMGRVLSCRSTWTARSAMRKG
jgi:phospholipase C